MNAPATRLPRWFSPDARRAGVLEQIGRTTGLSGWVLDLAEPSRSISVAVVSRGAVVARDAARHPREDFAKAVGKPVNCGFRIPWVVFDTDRVLSILRESPEAEIEVLIPEYDRLLEKDNAGWDISALRLADCFLYMLQLGIIDARDAVGRSGESDDAALFASPGRAGLIDPIFYLQSGGFTAADLAGAPVVAHYLSVGEARGVKPNALFDPRWYAYRTLSGSRGEGALRHYVETGERSGAKPCAVFEPLWYAKTYGIDLERACALGHYLRCRDRNAVNPNAYFDVEAYCARYPDLARAPVDAFTHWLNWGVFEGRSASTRFDAEFVWRRYLGANREINPFERFMELGAELGWQAVPTASGSLHRRIAENSAPSALFEPFEPPGEISPEAPKIVALYLPQFHAIPENDAWWGEGFTEWRNLMRAAPRYAGHVQPRIPRDLGFYDLAGSATMRRQVELARRSGVHAFCFYYYNFNGRRLLERPVETFLAEPDIDFPFCLLWANENWTRRWDGSEDEVLIRQDYRIEDDGALVADFARHMRDPRYLRTAAGRPLLFLYRADVVPDCAQRITKWRKAFRDDHGLAPLFVMAQAFGSEDPRPFGFDGALEFPPHKLADQLPTINSRVELLDPEFSGQI